MIVIDEDSVKPLPGYAEYLFKYSVSIFDSIVPHLADCGYVLMHSSFSSNFKDALVHYKRMYDHILTAEKEDDVTASNTRLSALSQFELIVEHINRAIYDLFVEVLQDIYGFQYIHLQAVIKGVSKSAISYDYIPKLMDNLERIKAQLYSLRSSGMGIFRTASLNDGEPIEDAGYIVKLADALRLVEETMEYIYSFMHIDELQDAYHYTENCVRALAPRNIYVAIEK